MIRAALLYPAGIVFLAAACSDEPDLPPLQFETEHFRYYTDEEIAVCPGLADWLEHHYAAHVQWLGVGIPAGKKIEYYKLYNMTELSEFCGSPHGDIPSGCVIGDDVYTTRSYHPHELIHVYAGELGFPPLFFVEGMAVMLGGGGGGAVNRDLPVELYVETDYFRDVAYPEFGDSYSAAGAFTRFMLDRYGKEACLGFYAAVPNEAAGAEIREAFLSIMGETLEDALAQWRTGPELTEAHIRLHLAECAAPSIEAPGAQFDGLACEDRDVLYPFSLARSFTVSGPAGVVLGLCAEGATQALLRSCDGVLSPERQLFSYTTGHLGSLRELWTDLEPGKYWLDVFSATADAALWVEIGAPVFADSCAEAQARIVGPDTTEVVFAGLLEGAGDDAPADGLADLSARFRIGEPRRAGVTRYSGFSVDLETLCLGGCPGDSTAACGDVGGTMLEADRDYTLTFADEAADSFLFGLQLSP